MKNLVLVTFVVVLLGLMIPSATVMAYDVGSTYENLFTAVQGETNASATYAAFADQAMEEGYSVIANLFRATSDAEARHANEEWAVLVSLGADDSERPVAGTPTVGTTADNLLAAFNGETEEYTGMYPDFLAVNDEDIAAARSIFNRAMRAEEVHAGNYADVLANLDDVDYINSTYAVVYRCPTCGEVVTELPANDRCPICYQPGANFAMYSSTCANLFASVQGETNASAAYTAFAAKAQEEGYPVIARLFRATAEAEARHANDEWNVLKDVFEVDDKDRPVAATPDVGTTAQNMQAAFDGETYECTVMYPDFLAVARAEGIDGAITIFNRAMKAEEVHAGNYKDVLDNLTDAKYINSKYGTVFRCPVCGEVVTERPQNRCPICGAAGDSFVMYPPELVDAVPSASVEKLTGNKNKLTVTVTEKFDDDTTTVVTDVFSIDNNAAGTYNVGSYKVFVDTKGNVQIRECYIVK